MVVTQSVHFRPKTYFAWGCFSKRHIFTPPSAISRPEAGRLALCFPGNLERAGEIPRKWKMLQYSSIFSVYPFIFDIQSDRH